MERKIEKGQKNRKINQMTKTLFAGSERGSICQTQPLPGHARVETSHHWWIQGIIWKADKPDHPGAKRVLAYF